MKKQKGFSLIGVLVIVGALLFTAGGVVVWNKKTSTGLIPTPTPLLVPTSKPSAQPTLQSKPISCETDVDCPPLLPCLPPECIGVACIYGECKNIPRESLICEDNSDCAFLDIRSCLAPEMFCGPEKLGDISEYKYGPWNKKWCQTYKQEFKRVRECLGVAYPVTNNQSLKAVCEDYYGKKICRRSK